MTKKGFWMLPVLAAVAAAALVCAGCGTLFGGGSRPRETEQSKLFLDGANDLLLERDNGMPPDVFKVAFEKKFPGVKVSRASHSTMGEDGYGSYGRVEFTYEGREYRMDMNGKENYTSVRQSLDLSPEEPTPAAETPAEQAPAEQTPAEQTPEGQQ